MNSRRGGTATWPGNGGADEAACVRSVGTLSGGVASGSLDDMPGISSCTSFQKCISASLGGGDGIVQGITVVAFHVT